MTDAYAVYEMHYREMVGLARALVGDLATAEDVVQDATIRLNGSLRRVNDPDRLVAYYRSIVLNLARNQLRSRTRGKHAAERLAHRDVQGGVHRDEGRADRTAVLAAVLDLPKRQQQCVLLRHYSDLDERTIASTLGISQGSVKKHLHRANSRLAIALKDIS